jgi:hypothetical protein
MKMMWFTTVISAGGGGGVCDGGGVVGSVFGAIPPQPAMIRQNASAAIILNGLLIRWISMNPAAHQLS